MKRRHNHPAVPQRNSKGPPTIMVVLMAAGVAVGLLVCVSFVWSVLHMPRIDGGATGENDDDDVSGRGRLKADPSRSLSTRPYTPERSRKSQSGFGEMDRREANFCRENLVQWADPYTTDGSSLLILPVGDSLSFHEQRRGEGHQAAAEDHQQLAAGGDDDVAFVVGTVADEEYKYFDVCVAEHAHHHRVNMHLHVLSGEADLYVSLAQREPKLDDCTWLSAQRGDDSIALPTYVEDFAKSASRMLHIGVRGRPLDQQQSLVGTAETRFNLSVSISNVEQSRVYRRMGLLRGRQVVMPPKSKE